MSAGLSSAPKPPWHNLGGVRTGCYPFCPSSSIVLGVRAKNSKPAAHSPIPVADISWRSKTSLSPVNCTNSQATRPTPLTVAQIKKRWRAASKVNGLFRSVQMLRSTKATAIEAAKFGSTPSKYSLGCPTIGLPSLSQWPRERSVSPPIPANP